MLTKNLLIKLIIFPSIILFTGSCIETTQEYYVNENGSGKVNVKVTMPLEMNMQMGQGNKDTAVSHQDTVKMIKKVNKIIDESKGIEAWNYINYKKNKEGKLHISFTAYYPDIKKVDLGDIPVIPVSEFSENKIKWGENESLAGSMKGGDREPKKIEVKEENLEKTIERIQDKFKKTRTMMNMMLTSFSLEAVYHLPYAVKNPYNLEKEGKYALELTMQGDDIFKNYEKLIETLIHKV